MWASVAISLPRDSVTPTRIRVVVDYNYPKMAWRRGEGGVGKTVGTLLQLRSHQPSDLPEVVPNSDPSEALSILRVVPLRDDLRRTLAPLISRLPMYLKRINSRLFVISDTAVALVSSVVKPSFRCGKLRSELDAVRCTGITTNEVLNLNKLQGTRLPSAFASLCALLQFIPCQLPQNSLARVLRWYPALDTWGRAPRTRNGDMNIPGVEYPRAVNLFGTTRMKKVRLRIERHANLRRTRVRCWAKFFVLINVNVRSSPSGPCTFRSYVQVMGTS
ncbi:hypothetical protein DBV15_04232 [Temnothorax longispinosus]|uniref:Uncharacterized protein n=1 Tax=Temnothorax longispinosus TaxID=300112 RepID=A0A4S2KLB8_9HYME|nr:hypothetical protein DBV15_04232 [Temnothorax longispinosus]